MRRRMIMQAGIGNDEIDYMHNPLERAEWLMDKTYDANTGELKEKENEYCTSKLSLQNCGYSIKFGSGNTSWPDIFIWNENGEYIGKFPYKNRSEVIIWAKAGYQYAIKVYRTTDSDLSGVAIVPINNEDTAINILIDLSNAGFVVSNDYIEVNINDYGMTTDNYIKKIQSSNYIIMNPMPDDRSNVINNKEALLWIIKYRSNILLGTRMFRTDIDAAKKYFAEHEPLILYK